MIKVSLRTALPHIPKKFRSYTPKGYGSAKGRLKLADKKTAHFYNFLLKDIKNKHVISSADIEKNVKKVFPGIEFSVEKNNDKSLSASLSSMTKEGALSGYEMSLKLDKDGCINKTPIVISQIMHEFIHLADRICAPKYEEGLNQLVYTFKYPVHLASHTQESNNSLSFLKDIFKQETYSAYCRALTFSQELYSNKIYNKSRVKIGENEYRKEISKIESPVFRISSIKRHIRGLEMEKRAYGKELSYQANFELLTFKREQKVPLSQIFLTLMDAPGAAIIETLGLDASQRLVKSFDKKLKMLKKVFGDEIAQFRANHWASLGKKYIRASEKK